jgi:hypothetical protein
VVEPVGELGIRVTDLSSALEPENVQMTEVPARQMQIDRVGQVAEGVGRADDETRPGGGSKSMPRPLTSSTRTVIQSAMNYRLFQFVKRRRLLIYHSTNSRPVSLPQNGPRA